MSTERLPVFSLIAEARVAEARVAEARVANNGDAEVTGAKRAARRWEGEGVVGSAETSTWDEEVKGERCLSVRTVTNGDP